MTRRDKCYLAGKRAKLLSIAQSAQAWTCLSEQVESLGDRDLPKFRDLISAIRAATIAGKMIDTGTAPLVDPSFPSLSSVKS